MDGTEVSVRLTKRSLMIIDDIVARNITFGSRRAFLRNAISTNAEYLMTKVEGQKSIHDMAYKLSDESRWINIDTQLYDIDCRLDPKDRLQDSPVVTEIPDGKDEILKKAAKCSGLNKSDLLRLCVIRHMYQVKSDESPEETDGVAMEGTDQRRVTHRWKQLDNKLDNMLDSMIDNVSRELTGEHVEDALKMTSEVSTYQRIASIYDGFKGTAGYKRLANVPNGRDALDVLEDISARAEQVKSVLDDADV